MKICKTALMAAAGLGLMATSANAASIVVDTFDGGGGWVVDGPLVIPGPITVLGPEQEVSDGGIVGGYRDLMVNSSSTNPLSTEMEVTGGQLEFSNDAGVSGVGTMTWDGQDGSSTSVGGVNTSGLGGIDITDGGTNDAFVLGIQLLDTDGLGVTINVWDMAGNQSSLTEIFNTSLVPQTGYLRLDEFAGAADLTRIGAIQLVLDGPENVDAVFDFIAVAPVPLGPALPPLLGALLMVGYLKRRQDRA